MDIFYLLHMCLGKGRLRNQERQMFMNVQLLSKKHTNSKTGTVFLVYYLLQFYNLLKSVENGYRAELPSFGLIILPVCMAFCNSGVPEEVNPP